MRFHLIAAIAASTLSAMSFSVSRRFECQIVLFHAIRPTLTPVTPLTDFVMICIIKLEILPILILVVTPSQPKGSGRKRSFTVIAAPMGFVRIGFGSCCPYLLSISYA